MRTHKIELTKEQNWQVIANSKDETLVNLAKFGGMCRDYTYWVTDTDLKAITAAIGTDPVILRTVD
jgi:hypothetical protein